MRISDWSSDVCSSDLCVEEHAESAGNENQRHEKDAPHEKRRQQYRIRGSRRTAHDLRLGWLERQDRKSVVSGKSVSDRVDLGGRRIIKKKKERKQNIYSRHT